MHSRIVVISDHLETQMAEHAERYDWWTLGGRWTGSFRLRRECSGVLGKREQPEIEKRFGGELKKRALPSNAADQARKGDIDWTLTEFPGSAGRYPQWRMARALRQRSVRRHLRRNSYAPQRAWRQEFRHSRDRDGCQAAGRPRRAREVERLDAPVWWRASRTTRC